MFLDLYQWKITSALICQLVLEVRIQKVYRAFKENGVLQFSVASHGYVFSSTGESKKICYYSITSRMVEPKEKKMTSTLKIYEVV